MCINILLSEAFKDGGAKKSFIDYIDENHLNDYIEVVSKMDFDMYKYIVSFDTLEILKYTEIDHKKLFLELHTDYEELIRDNEQHFNSFDKVIVSSLAFKEKLNKMNIQVSDYLQDFVLENDTRINRIITKINHQEDYSKLETTEEKVKFLTTIKDKLIVNDIEESDRKIIEETIKINPYTLSYANKKLTDDKELVMEAITKSGYVISYASERLKKDKEVALTAIKSREGAIRYIDKSLKYNKEFIEEALKVNEFIIFELDEKEQLIHNNIKKLIK